jgi:aryl-alcohol dehydrogenase-like predicted oxidoreductase
VRYKLLGRSGLRVSELCLGTMTFGEEWGWGSSPEESRRVFDAFAEAGGNFLDTANRYTEGTSERLVGEMIRPDREHWVLATKYTLTMDRQDPNFSGNHRKNMMQSVEASLKRLGTDFIDLYWLHAWDFTTAVDEVMRAFDDLVRQGKVLHVGVSDAPAWIVSQANTLADLRGWTPFCALQVEYSLIERSVERELLPMARAFGLAVTPWSPLGSGMLTGKYESLDDWRKPDARLSEGSHRLTERNLAIARAVTETAGQVGASPAQVAIAWVLGRRGTMIPILGARTPKQLQDNLGCLDVELPADALAKLDAVSAVEPGFPHDFLKRQPIREIVYSAKADRIDLPE